METPSLRRGRAGWEHKSQAPLRGRVGGAPHPSNDHHALWAQGRRCLCHHGARLYFSQLRWTHNSGRVDGLQEESSGGCRGLFLGPVPGPHSPTSHSPGLAALVQRDMSPWGHHDRSPGPLPPVQPHGETKCRQMPWASGPSTGLAVVWFSALAGVCRGWGQLTVETEPLRFGPCASEEGAATWSHSPEAPSAGQGPGEEDTQSCQQSTCVGSLSQQGLLTRRHGQQERKGQKQGIPSLP